MANKKRLVYLAQGNASFVLQDIDELGSYYTVMPVIFMVKKKFQVPFQLVALFVRILLSSNKAILISFGGYHSFIGVMAAKIKRIPSFIILNGTDSVYMEKYNYGYLNTGLLKWMTLKSYDWANKLLPVSQSLIETKNDFAFEETKKLGLKAITERNYSYQVIPNGFKLSFWMEGNFERNNHSFITVIAQENKAIHKGLDLIIDLAKLHPTWVFNIAGLKQYRGSPENVTFLGYLSPIELRHKYQLSKYYLQLSIWEGFGCALCEAMLCGCIPIVSNVNILPEIVGDTGLILNKRNIKDLDKLISESDEPKASPRKRIASHYSIESRIQKLVRVIDYG